MNRFFTKVTRFFRKLRAFFPSKLPIGDVKFEAWYADIADIYGLPQDNDSIRQALCAMIMGLEANWRDKNGKVHFTFYTPKRFFGLSLLKGASQQQAYNTMQDVRVRFEARKAAEAKAQAEAAGINKPAEVTAATVTNGSGQQA
jgi:hypothetical protein